MRVNPFFAFASIQVQTVDCVPTISLEQDRR